MSETIKWAVFLTALLVGVPVMAMLMRIRPALVWFFVLLFFFSALNDPNGIQSINLISRESYRGSSRGMEVTVNDLIALALAIHVLTHRSSRFRRNRPSLEGVCISVYVCFGVVSLVAAFVPLYAWFEWWKMLRGLLVYYVFTRLIDRREKAAKLIEIFSLMILFQIPFVLYQKYVLGIYRATGTLPHMNTLAMIMNLLVTPVFAAFLITEDMSRKWQIFPIGGAIFNVLATASRGALISLGAAFVFCLSFLRSRHLNPQRLSVLGLMLVGGLLVSWKASDTIIERFLTAPKESEETREGFNDCAAEMARDLVFGVGLNNFSYAVGNTPYGEAAPNLPEGGKDDGVAHHVYWLTAAEQGWIGLVLFLLMILAVQFRSLMLIVKSKDQLLKAIGVGCFAGLFALHLQGFLEWILRQTNVWFLFCALAGTLSAIGFLNRSGNPQFPRKALHDSAGKSRL